MEHLNELNEFLKPSTRIDVKSLALHHVLSMTGHFDSKRLLVSHPKILTSVLLLAFKKDEQSSVSKDAFFTLINLSADEMTASDMMQKNPALVRLLIDYLVDAESKFSDTACVILSNLSRGKKNSELIFNYFENSESSSEKNNNSKSNITLEKLLTVFCTENFNKKNNLDYLAPFICNLTQLDEVQNLILNNDLLLMRLLPYTNYSKSVIRRGGIIGAIKNCCFNYDYHDKLLFSDEIDILSRLLLPLAGPEEFNDDEMDKLPVDLQYLPLDKERESDPDICTMILETIMMLCSHKNCRQYVKDKNAYIILREFHKSTQDEKVKSTCEKVIQFLISDEPESGMENLHQVPIPEDLSQKFYEFDKDELEKNFN